MNRQKMSAVDTAWLRMDSAQNLMMIVGVWMFDEELDAARVRRLLRAKLLRHRRFKQRAIVDATGAWWQDDDQFDLDHHLKLHRLAQPGDDSKLKAFVAEQAGRALDAQRPLWQFHLVTGYDGRSALVIRIHHCIADGIALVAVMMAMTEAGEDAEASLDDDNDDASGEPSPAESNPWRPYLQPLTQRVIAAIEVGGTLWSKSLGLLANPDKLVDYAQVGVRLLKDINRLALMPSDSPTRLKGKPGAAKAVAWNKPVPLDEVKQVGRGLQASVNDVLLACVAGALRNYLLDCGDAIADDCEVRAMVPVNLRPPEQALQLGNRFGLVPLCLPVGVADPVARVHEVRRRMDELKSSYQAVLAFGLLGAVGLVPKPVQAQILDLLAKKASAVMTNVPGPQQPLRFAGAPIERILFWVPQSGDIGLGVSILSYNGGVQFGVISDATLTPKPDRIIAGFEPEFVKLKQALASARGGRTAKAKSAARPRPRAAPTDGRQANGRKPSTPALEPAATPKRNGAVASDPTPKKRVTAATRGGAIVPDKATKRVPAAPRKRVARTAPARD